MPDVEIAKVDNGAIATKIDVLIRLYIDNIARQKLAFWEIMLNSPL
jgi:hypothetical protein